MHGVVHVEIPARDLRRAKDFYGKVFGWTFQDMGKDYTLFTPPGGGVGGGINKVSKVPKRPVVQAYLEVANIDATLKDIKKARGTVVRDKSEVPGHGWWAAFADPQGTVLFLWQSLPGRR
jgi:predicted enzyme related to lactoylglutathione lyase